MGSDANDRQHCKRSTTHCAIDTSYVWVVMLMIDNTVSEVRHTAIDTSYVRVVMLMMDSTVSELIPVIYG